ncbi:MAG TPA: malto-oligosyltrehalose trehalohydrolase [Acidimicrobiales bacterium]|nr:malto-oligosyltrehalose trehalohydrolase [Acidimicrobiales bacterium]
MTVFSVWAPDHESVDLQLDDRVVPMAARDGGWWQVDVPDAAPGTRYRFALDGGPGRPDPRSPWQPEGIDGPSATVDHSAFAWTDQSWRSRSWPSVVLYECHIGTFTEAGTFDAAIGRLDHLVALGVNAVEVLPVAEGSGDRGWGYDGVDLWAPHHAYGGPDGFKRFVDACHGRGIAVVLDVVYNHLGPAGNYLAEFGPYFTDRYQTPWGSAVNVDGAGSDEVRRFIIDNARMWMVDYHVDGLRLDAVHAIIDLSALPILEELACAVDDLAGHLGRPLWLIAESDRNDPRLVAAPEAGGFGLTATWDDEWHHALHSALTDDRSGYYEDFGPLSLVARAMEHGYVYGRHWSPHRNRHHGRPLGDLPRSRLVAFTQNHDQVGNRADGARLAALTSPGRLRVAAALLLTGPFVPMLWMGEEWGASTPWQYFTDHRDPELGAAVTEGRTHEFGYFGWDPDQVPDPQDRVTFDRSILRWDELDDPQHAALLVWHRDLLELRRGIEDLTASAVADTTCRADDAAGTLQMTRRGVLVSVNIGPDSARFKLPAGSRLLLGSDQGIEIGDGWVRVPPDAVAITASPR